MAKCPPVREDNPQAVASGLSYVQVDKHGITILYHLHQYHQFGDKVGKGGVKDIKVLLCPKYTVPKYPLNTRDKTLHKHNSIPNAGSGIRFDFRQSFTVR